MAQLRPKTTFKGPEGRYAMEGERLTGLLSFSPQRATRLTLATLGNADDGHTYIVFNVGDFVHICTPGGTDKVGAARLVCKALGRAEGGGGAAQHTHAYTT